MAILVLWALAVLVLILAWRWRWPWWLLLLAVLLAAIAFVLAWVFCVDLFFRAALYILVAITALAIRKFATW